ncbi:MAG: hypothetical protein ABSF21_05450 [Dehalococcoidia bacterium]
MDPLWVSVGVTVVLVGITGYYACQTRKIARASEDAARAAVEQAQELRQQRISASQPIVWPMIAGWKIYRLEVDIENIGNGPALDIDIFVGRGDDPIYEDNNHERHSYMIAREKRKHNFLIPQNPTQDSYGQPSPDKDTLANIAGKYTLLVEWRDLYKSGPFFQAKLPFSLEIDSGGKLYVKEGVVVIDRVIEKTILRR